jgi:hypothetical protein
MKKQALLSIAFLLVNGLLILVTVSASAETAGTWQMTGSMNISRRNAQIYPLPDGKILVSGGTNTTGVDGTASIFYDSAEIYDPVTGTWSNAGSLTTGGRVLHTLTLLPNGKILLTGGWNGYEALSTAEVYNPITGTWTVISSMTRARANHKQRILYDGRVLITGGFDSTGTAINTAEIYNPTTGAFSATTGTMAEGRYAHTLNTVSDGKILVAGGFETGGVELRSAQLFDPATGTFTSAGSLVHARGNHNATSLPNGKVLITGGVGGSGALSSSELYDPESNLFAEEASLNQARQNHSVYLLANGLVLISGGNISPSKDWDIQTNFLSSAELYDWGTHSFKTTASKANSTSGGNTTPLWTGKLLVTGGGTNQTELYTPEMSGTPDTWVATGSLNSARTNAIVDYLDDGRVLLVGGLDSSGNPMASAEVYDYLTGNFNLTGNMSSARQHHYGTLLYTGKVLVTGGRPNAASGVLNSAELFDPLTETFTPTGNMQRYRRLHRTTELPNGKILVTGGLGGTSNTSNSYLSGAEIYDPATGKFTFTNGNLISARYNHVSALLYTGKVLIAGGYGSGSVLLKTAELYDPATGTFTATGSMITGRSVASQNRLPNGKMLISGGTDELGTPVQTMEIYDPTTGTFTAAGDSLTLRYGNKINRLPNGKLIFVGGKTSADDAAVTNSTDTYNHLTGKFSISGDLITGRRHFGQWILPNGQILVAGGFAANGTALSSAELYTSRIADVFSDVSRSYWAYDYIMSIYNAHITTGYGGTSEFKPDYEVTREQMAAFIVRAKQGEPASTTCDSGCYFTDVNTSGWACKYIQTLYDLGITTGYGGTNQYRPELTVTREQMAAFIVRAMPEGEPDANYCDSGSPFSDVPTTSWSCKYIKKLYENHITTGYGGTNLYRPELIVTRAQMAAFIGRAFLGME